MADDDLGPEGFGTRGIPSARRGYDKRVVDTLVSEAVERWVELKRRYDALRAEVDRAGGLEHLARDLKAVGDDVSRILEAAKEAADGMRVRAQSDADVVGTGAAAGAAAVVQEAEDQAFQTRRDAWETGAELLALVRETASAILAEAEDDALLVRAEAERESHRRLAVTRKEQDDMIRSGRYELERQITNARDLAAEMLSVARTEEVSLVPTPDQEERRREVLGEIERLRASRGIEAINVLPAEPVPVRRSFEVLPGEVDSGLPDLSDALAAEVEQLGADRGGRRPDTAPRAAQSSRRSARSVPDDVGTLFEALRTTAEVDVLMGEGDSDPVSFHERVVVQAYNLGLRDLKRRIVDLQAVALEGLRTTGWSPEARAVTAELSPSFDQAVQRASAGGVEAARALGGVEAGQPAGSDRRLADIGNPIHFDGHLEAVPVDRGRFRQAVLEDDADAVALVDLDRRTRRSPVVAPHVHRLERNDSPLHRLCRQVEHLHSVLEGMRQARQIRCHHQKRRLPPGGSDALGGGEGRPRERRAAKELSSRCFHAIPPESRTNVDSTPGGCRDSSGRNQIRRMEIR